MDTIAHYLDHIGPAGWMFAGAGVANFAYNDWLLGVLLIAMPVLASVRAHEEECWRDTPDS